MVRRCLQCGKDLPDQNAKFCSRTCHHASLAFRQQMSAAQIGEKNHNYGRKHTEGTKRKMREAQMGEKSHRWKGGRGLDPEGYTLIHRSLLTADQLAIVEPMLRKGDRYLLEHRITFALHLRRPLTSTEVVHHENGVADNSIENLRLFASQTEHQKHHRKLQRTRTMEAA